VTALGFSRREAAEWARPAAPVEPAVDVLIPTKDRTAALAVTLAGLAGQDDPSFRIILSDQSPTQIEADHVVRSLLRLLRAQGRSVEVHRHLPVRGMAEQRAFLLSKASCDHVLFLDDDVWLEPGTLELLDTALDRLGCGFVGAAVQGLSYLDDRRPAETADFEIWQHAVHPERIRRGTPEFERFRLHNAANLAHIAADLGLGRNEWVAYKIAWVGGCVMFRRDALVETGGFGFWRELPPQHVGEDVAAQWRVMERYGGAGILPSGAVHLEAPTTLPEREVEASTVLFQEREPPANSAAKPSRAQ
jgi:GT2 family glycosyltransferase